MIIREGAKMSKSRGNVVNPDEYIEKWGADTFRTYLMFLGPYEEGGDFRDQSVTGVRSFLNRLWSTAVSATTDGSADLAVMRKLHQTIRKVSEDIPRLSYNTAIAAMMEYMNVLRAGERTPHVDEVRPLVQLVSPFAPHIAEELWSVLGESPSKLDAGWPSYDEPLVTEERVTMAVKVNRKTRGTISVPTTATQDDAIAAVTAEPSLARFVTGPVKRVIFVKGRMVNLVT
jgi:leucyl-tRNA synthetase